jgi:hypothetical protein
MSVCVDDKIDARSEIVKMWSQPPSVHFQLIIVGNDKSLRGADSSRLQTCRFATAAVLITTVRDDDCIQKAVAGVCNLILERDRRQAPCPFQS